MRIAVIVIGLPCFFFIKHILNYGKVRIISIEMLLDSGVSEGLG
jgi:hypothetical protein